MGNANGREGENGYAPPPARALVSDGFPPSSDGLRLEDHRMGGSPPESPRRSRSPLLFAPQVPIAPLQRAADDPPVYDNSCMTDSHGPIDTPHEKRIPTLITWNHGGNDVAVEGSWDNWTSRRGLQRSGKDHCILLVLPFGVYHYRFIVDGEWRYIADLPYITDERGQATNIIDVNDYVPEISENVSEFEPPPSPNSSYGRPFPADEDFAKEPPALPPQLHLTVLGPQNSDESSGKPQHVLLNHLFIERGWASQSLVALGLTHRFQSKYVTVVLYKPMRRH